jgi:hypothetical protein
LRFHSAFAELVFGLVAGGGACAGEEFGDIHETRIG